MNSTPSSLPSSAFSKISITSSMPSTAMKLSIPRARLSPPGVAHLSPITPVFSKSSTSLSSSFFRLCLTTLYISEIATISSIFVSLTSSLSLIKEILDVHGAIKNIPILLSGCFFSASSRAIAATISTGGLYSSTLSIRLGNFICMSFSTAGHPDDISGFCSLPLAISFFVAPLIISAPIASS